MRKTLRPLVSAGLLIATVVLLQLRSTGETVPLRKPLDAMPATVGEWQRREAALLEGGVLEVLKVKEYLVRRYVDPAGRNLWLFIGYWDTQRKGAQVHSPKNCLPGAGWEPLEASRVTIPLRGPHGPITVNRYLVQKDREQQLVLYWYHAQGQPIADEFAARVQMVRSAIARNRTDGALIRISGPVYGSVAETSEHMTRYVQALYPILDEHLPG